MSFSPTQRRLAAAGSLALAATVALATPAPAQAAGSRAYSGSAYGSTAKVGSLVNSGKTSSVGLCTTTAPKSASNNTAKIVLPGVGRIGAATTKVTTSKSSGQLTTSTTTTGSTSLVGDLVQASAITSTAKVKYSSAGYTRAASTVFTNLRVAGTSVTARPGVDTIISIPDVATVRINGQSTSTTNGAHSITVTGLRITLLAGNRLGLPTGDIVVGVATSDLRDPVHRLASGAAYGTLVNVAGVVKSGATAAVGQPCAGSNGVTLTNSVDSTTLGSALHVGAVRSATKSTDTSAKTLSVATNTVAGIDLLDGVVTIDAVEAKAATTAKGTSTPSSSSSGTKVVGLKVNGVSRTVSTAENTSINIAGVGTLYLHRALRTSTGIQVYAVQLKLSTASQGLGVGTVITVGSAKTGVAAH
ncbi:choice-of-anchor P family protein [uncultured Friedmanniella sp.]|uniref:choice-of-anchor P family protein n=1 Tax=uncultured Friedmanniella sp. TaxID=335381 RepID=UPI0035CC6D71